MAKVTYNPLLNSGLDFEGNGGSSPSGPAERYTANFNATSDWTLNSGYYQITVSAGTHGKGINPNVMILELDSGSYAQVTVDSCVYDSFGNVTFQVLASPDLRFIGRILII